MHQERGAPHLADVLEVRAVMYQGININYAATAATAVKNGFGEPSHRA